MKVSEAMTPNPRVVSPDEPISEAAKLMGECDAGVLPVGEEERLVGMVTDRDIVIRAVAEQLSPDTPVRDVMSAEVLYCFEDESIDRVAQRMAEERVRRVPVLNRHNKLVGILSLGDISQKANALTTARAVAAISEPGGPHTQTLH